MRKTAFIAMSFFLSGCLSDMQRVAEETKQEVSTSVQEIRQTKEGAQISTALEICLDPHISDSARVAACKPVLLKLPEDRLSDYMGIPMRIMQEESVKREVAVAGLGKVEIDLPNVLYVGKAGERDYSLELSPTAEELHAVLVMATLQATGDIAKKAMKPGLTAAEMDELRVFGKRLIYAGTAILGAVKLADLSNGIRSQVKLLASGDISAVGFKEGVFQRVASLTKVVPIEDRTRGLEKLRELARNLSLSEVDQRTISTLADIRLGLR